MTRAEKFGAAIWLVTAAALGGLAAFYQFGGGR